MSADLIHTLLKNYTDLLKRVDSLIRHIEKKYPGEIACKKGCDSCCKFLSLFPVEAFAISEAFTRLPEETKNTIVQQLRQKEGACPLLIDNACLLYPARPVICRTHGYPIYMEEKGELLVDFCPENFKGRTDFPKDALLSIEQLNTTLTAVNSLFLNAIDAEPPFPERIPMSKALFLLDQIK